MKIIPAIDLMDGQVVRLFQGDPKKKTVYSKDPIMVAKKWEQEGADLIHLVDLDATLGLGSNIELVKNLITEISIPVEVAGGLRDEKTISEVSQLAGRVVLGTIAFEDKDTVKKLGDSIGKKKMIISVDHMEGTIVVNGWKKSTGIKLIEGMKEFLEMGFTEFLLTNISRDGTMQGPDLEFLKKACSLENTNVIASGGISNIGDIYNVKQCNAYGVILGKALYENKVTIEEAKKI